MKKPQIFNLKFHLIAEDIKGIYEASFPGGFFKLTDRVAPSGRRYQFIKMGVNVGPPPSPKKQDVVLNGVHMILKWNGYVRKNGKRIPGWTQYSYKLDTDQVKSLLSGKVSTTDYHISLHTVSESINIRTVREKLILAAMRKYSSINGRYNRNGHPWLRPLRKVANIPDITVKERRELWPFR